MTETAFNFELGSLVKDSKCGRHLMLTAAGHAAVGTKAYRGAFCLGLRNEGLISFSVACKKAKNSPTGAITAYFDEVSRGTLGRMR